MKLLVLGGTVFLGRHTVQRAAQRGHVVTMFNRGRTNPDLFPELEHIQGDRDGGLGALKGRKWDAVIDTSGYLPRLVGDSVRALSGSADQYVFISTISVYADSTQPGIDEDSPVHSPPDDESIEDVTGETYGPLKVACEQAVQSDFPGPTLIIRPGLIVGPHDPTDRYTYWPRRLARPGRALAPGSPDRPVQFIDVRDLVDWILDMTEAKSLGAYNATGPQKPLTMGELLEQTRQAIDGEAELVWIPEDFLIDAGVDPFSEVPLWLPEEQNGLLEVDISKALEAGLSIRPLEETAQDTFAWDEERPPVLQRSAGLDPARELALLDAYVAQQESQ